METSCLLSMLLLVETRTFILGWLTSRRQHRYAERSIECNKRYIGEKEYAQLPSLLGSNSAISGKKVVLCDLFSSGTEVPSTNVLEKYVHYVSSHRFEVLNSLL